MKQSPFPRPRFCCPTGYERYYGLPATLPARRDFTGSPLIRAHRFPSEQPQTRGQRGLPHFPHRPFRPCRSLYLGGFMTAALPGSTRRPWPSPRFPRLGSPLSPRTRLASRGGRIHVTLRPGRSLPQKGFRHWASTPDVSLRRRQSATRRPGAYRDRTSTGTADASLCPDQVVLLDITSLRNGGHTELRTSSARCLARRGRDSPRPGSVASAHHGVMGRTGDQAKHPEEEGEHAPDGVSRHSPRRAIPVTPHHPT